MTMTIATDTAKNVGKKTVQVIQNGVAFTLETGAIGLKFLSDLVKGNKSIKISVVKKV